MQIRPLEAKADLALVLQFYRDAPDYWQLAEGVAPGEAKARAFFTDGPPGCDPSQSYRLGAFIEGRLAGLAELSFGFPAPGDAYLGFMMFAPSARGAGLGRALLAHIEGLARAAGAESLYLAVLGVNPRGRAFWEREGFTATGVSAAVGSSNPRDEVHRLVKAL